MAKFEILYEYSRIDKAANRLSVELSDLIHAGASGQVQICVKVYGNESNQTRSRISIDGHTGELTEIELAELEKEAADEMGSTKLDAQQMAFQRWFNRCSSEMPAGFFELDEEILRFFELPSTESVNLFEAYKRDESDWWSVEFDPPITIRKNDLYVLENEIKRLTTPSSTNQFFTSKPMMTREKNTLLTIIAVLCNEAKIPYDKPAKAAGMIQSTAAAMGVSIGETTIEGHLKKIPDALGTRMK